jgi:hypothetical protein
MEMVHKAMGVIVDDHLMDALFFSFSSRCIKDHYLTNTHHSLIVYGKPYSPVFDLHKIDFQCLLLLKPCNPELLVPMPVRALSIEQLIGYDCQPLKVAAYIRI